MRQILHLRAMPTRVLTSLLLSLLVFMPLACRKKTPQVQINVDKILVDDTLSAEGLKISKDDVRQGLKDSLKTGALHFKPGGPYLLRVSAMTGRMPPEPGGFPVLVLKGQLKARQSGRADSFSATIQERADSAAETAGALLEKASADLCERLAILFDLSRQNTDVLIQALKDKRQWYRLQALNTLAKAKDPKSFAAILPLLNDPDEVIALRAVGALVSLGDPRAVKALTELTRQRGPAFVRQVVYAVAAIGGREAEAYLFTLATGHSDASVREAAQAAQKLIKASTGTKAAQGAAHAGAVGQESNP